ncbi:MAG: substrate-binding domain-containing protein [Firmicutes bacterium]|nr:substrate-binding domain-containing protein [Bacillota bacterium]MCL5056688.1 substrate-binding domain-containing protein [Actinomycetota bacterium]
MRLPAALRILALAAGISLLWGCGKKEEKKPLSPPVKIAVCFDDLNRDGNKIIKKVIEGREKKDNVEIMWYDAENDPEKQKKQLEKLADQKVKAAIVQFIDLSAGAEVMRGLVEKNIKVIALERLPADAPADAYVASDHNLAGQLLAGFAINAGRKAAGLPAPPDPGENTEQSQQGQGQQKQLDQGQQGQAGASVPPEAQLGGKVPIGAILLTGDPSDSMSGEIAASARSSLKGSSEVNLLSEVPVPKGDPAQVPVVLQKEMVRLGSGVQAVLATDSRLAVAAAAILKNAGINNRVLTAGVGADEKASKALESGEHDAEIDTRPDLLGQYTLDAAISLVNGGRWQYDGQTASGSYSVPSRITPVRLIRSDNVFLLKQQWKDLEGNKEKKESSDSGSSGGSENSGEGQGGDGDKQGSEKEGGEQGEKEKGGQGKKTMLRITTQDGKTMEVEINGEIKKIESVGGGQGSQNEQQGQQGGQ